MDVNAESIADWVGQEEGVGYLKGGESKRFACTLLGADSMGIVATYEQDGRMLKRFVPWRVIEYIHLVDEETRQWREQRRAQQPPDL